MALWLVAGSAWAGTWQLTFDGTAQVQDTTLEEGNASPQGDASKLVVQGPEKGDAAVVLVQVPDLVGPRTTQVPAGASVATAYISMIPSDITHVDELLGWSVAEAWDEASATWSDRRSGVAWAGDGVSGGSIRAECGPVQPIGDTARLDIATCSDDIFDGTANHGWVLTIPAGSDDVSVPATESGLDGTPSVYVAFTASDDDGDGYWAGTASGYDCDDTNVDVHPGAIERANNGLDDDCNGFVDDDSTSGGDTGPTGDSGLEADADGDRMPPGSGLDCDDTNPDIYAGHDEWCDGFDNDCNGKVDDECVDASPEALGEGCSCSAHGSGVAPALALVVVLVGSRRRQRGVP